MIGYREGRTLSSWIATGLVLLAGLIALAVLASRLRPFLAPLWAEDPKP